MADIAFEKDLSVAETGIEGLKVVDLAVHGDSRGWFKENWQRPGFVAARIDHRFAQKNQPLSSGVVFHRLHFQIKHPQSKHMHVFAGEAFDDAIDFREVSATNGK